MGIISWAVLGLIVGALAKWIMPGKDPGGCLVTILLGIGGAGVFGWIATMLVLGAFTGFNLWSLLVATGGAVLLLWLYRIMKK